MRVKFLAKGNKGSSVLCKDRRYQIDPYYSYSTVI